ncbi:MAG TPA: glycosyltransferase [Chitinophagaceae bacterium]|nr:glycosyltransferase [Chitinophagaceae bacterium]
MIPKILHYCWFGSKELPENSRRLITEWARLHPEWTMVRWDEQNSPMDLPYIKAAYAKKKWANISNLVRLYALMMQGGIYLDTDMQIIKPLDPLLDARCFLGFEAGSQDDPVFWVNNAIMGAEAAHPFAADAFQALQQKFDGTEDANLSAPVLMTDLLKEKWGLEKYGQQEISGIHIYPLEFFYPVKGYESYKTKTELTELPAQTYTVHHWNRSWYSSEMFVHDIEMLQAYVADLQTALTRTSQELDKKLTEVKELGSINKELQHSNDRYKKIMASINDYLQQPVENQVLPETDLVEKIREMIAEPRQESEETISF